MGNYKYNKDNKHVENQWHLRGIFILKLHEA